MTVSVRNILGTAIVALVLAMAPRTGTADVSLEEGFRNPPDSAKPYTWWHWMDGNITRVGIKADLEAMKKAGIGGVQIFNVDQRIPPGPVKFLSPQWREMVQYAIQEADRLGLKVAMQNCAGWSNSGGPWIQPEHAMQVVAWSDKIVKGPMHFSEVLPQPKAPRVVHEVPYYRDIAVMAFPVPPGGDAPAAVKSILGKTAVVRKDSLDPDLSGKKAPPAIDPGAITVLTDKMDSSGKLTWDVPQGDWVILRLGYTPTGQTNHPAPPEGHGLEVDKMSREALDAHWNGMMAKVIADAGPLAGKTLNGVLIDSYEVGSQNWTPKFREEFRKRRGYDLTPWMPVLTGRTVGSKEQSERFLWDFRRTVADLFAENYFGYFAELCHKHGMLFFTEPYGSGLFDDLQCAGKADVPMGEFWVGAAGNMRSVKMAASGGHTYGRRIIGAESFTANAERGRWLVEPYGIKTLGDLVFCNGVNRFIFHRYAHQPWLNLKPGMTMGKWGTHLERTITWWNEASAWFKYVARCQYLLQQGTFVADAIYYDGEGGARNPPDRRRLRPRLPEGYDYDSCDATVLRKDMSVRGGRIELSDGMSYAILILPDTPFMPLETAEKIRDLVRAGATVVGPKPRQSPSLSGYPECDEQVRRIADEVWGDVDGASVMEHTFGKGRVVWGRPLADVLKDLHVAPDFEYRRVTPGAKLVWIHRRIGNVDVYFVSNQQYNPVRVECSFRVSGRTPELWHAYTGKTEVAPVYREEEGRTVVPLRLEPAEAVFVVFQRPATAKHLEDVALAGQRSHPPKLVILKARYEAPDGRGADVTDQVAKMVARGQYSIPATNAEFGDPVYKVVKRLRVEYELDGKRKQKTVKENETLSLLDSSFAAKAFPPFELSTAPDGSVALTPWQAGAYEIRDAKGDKRTLQVDKEPDTVKVPGPWRVEFPPHLGAPPSIKLDKLISWPDHPDPGVRYFSGTATYTTEFEVPKQALGPKRVTVLDLGRVKNFATVKLNGQDFGILWKAPFRLDVSGALKAGKNNLEVKVTNLWPNRLIGDEQLPPDVEWDGESLKRWPDWLTQGKPRPSTGRVTFTTWRFYTKDSPLLESGLIGPVTVRSANQIRLAAPLAIRDTMGILKGNSH